MRFSKLLFFLICFCFFASIGNSAIINGVEDKEILNLIKSQISNWDDISKDSISAEFKMRKDRRAIKRILRSFSYFDSEVKVRQQKDSVIFDIVLNERYKFDDVLVTYQDQKEYRSGLKVGQVFDLIGIPYDSYTDTKQLSDGSDKIADFLKDRGFAFVKVYPPKIKKDEKTKKIKAIYKVDLNGKTIIDETIINIKSKKNPKLLEPFVRNRISWKDGDVYDRQKIDNMKDDLISSKIFSGISVKLSDPIKDQKDPTIVHATMLLDIEEALLRDVAAGIKYGSAEKFGILLSWTHYNINGKGSSISGTLDANRKNKYFRFKYDVPDLFYKKQRLSNQAFYTSEDVSSYEVSKIGAESMLWQTFGMKFHTGIGVCYEESETSDKITKEDTEFKAIGVPLGLGFDTSEEYLDPQGGFRCRAMLTPYFGNSANLTILLGKASFYIPFKKNEFRNMMVIAIYSKYGSIFTKQRNKIPRDKLFFAGGAGSVRGYGYQKLGPINENKKPLGGESVFEIGVEPRFRVSENLGFVAFFEGGNVYSKKMTNPLRKLLFGYGFGVRYYTPFGPIRLDIAFPTKIRKTKSVKKEDGTMTKRRKIDSIFNLYISIGQAF